MIAGLGRAGRFVPRWRVDIRWRQRALSIQPSRAGRIAVGLVAALAVAGVVWLGLGTLAQHRRIAAREAAAQRIVKASGNLRATAVQLRAALARTRHDLVALASRQPALYADTDRARLALKEAQRHLLRLQQARAPSKAARLIAQADDQAAAIARAQARTEQELQQAEAQRAALAARLARAQSALSAGTQQAAASERRLQRVLHQVELARASTVGGRGKRVRRMAAGVVAAPAAGGAWGKLTHLLASSGVDVEQFFARFGVQRGIGGPFIPARDAPRPPSRAQRAAFRMMLHALPLSVPLHVAYRIGSPFGDRHDPFNGRAEFHPGIDLDAPYGTPVYATAPGVVTHAGWMDGYGRMVEVDDGSGITTRYAHLHRYTVVVGEHIKAGTRVGFLGSTGRSTGPHLHYEIRVNGVPRNPALFLRVGHEVARSPIVAISTR